MNNTKIINCIEESTTNELLSIDLIIKLIESTSRFEFITKDEFGLKFYDTYWEKYSILSFNWSLPQLMDWIVTFYSKDFERRGVELARKQIRKSLGIIENKLKIEFE